MLLRNDLTLYDRIGAAWWDEDGPARGLHALNGPRFQHWDAVVPAYAGKRAVDVGCGGGLVAAEMLARGARVLGVDRSRPSLRAARDHDCAGAALYVEADGRALPVRTVSADLVLCCDLLEHLDATGRAKLLAECARILVPGGLLLYDTINRTFLARLVVVHLFEALGVVPRGTHDPALFVTPRELDQALRAASLDPVSRSGFVFAGLPGRAPHRMTRWQGLSYVGVARK